MATQINLHPITVEQYENSFEGYPGLGDELINGRIVMNPPPKPLHQHIRKNIEWLLDPFCKVENYAANGNTGIELTPFNLLTPDVFIVSVPAWKRAMRAGEYLKVKPLLVVEILSPGQAIGDKLAVYLTAQIDAIWVVDPKTRTVAVYNWREKLPYQSNDEIMLPPPLKGMVQVADFFAGAPE